jgi:hypothetical protein
MSHTIQEHAGPVIVQRERAWLHGPTARFLRHFLEMVVAMMIGMAVLGLVVRAALSALGYPEGLRPFPELSATAMTLEMTLPMAVWMLYRGHRPRLVGEMSGAMIAPVVGVVALCLVHVLPSSSAPTIAHVTMFPAMLGAMLYRRAEYALPHGQMSNSVVAARHRGHGTSTQSGESAPATGPGI